jgi:hypothetical protein
MRMSRQRRSSAILAQHHVSVAGSGREVMGARGGSGVRALLAKEEGRGERGRGERRWQHPFKGEWREAEEKGGWCGA